MEVIECEQGTEIWHRARMGIPTASMFGKLMMKGRGGSSSEERTTYMHKLAGEIITGEPMESFANRDTRRGHAQEDEAARHYAFIKGVELQRVGFIRKGRAGASPDRLVGNDGGLELKAKLPHLVIGLILANEFPVEHRAQCQGQLWITDREWIDLSVYCPKMPPFIVRTYRDELFIADLAREVRIFNEELDLVVDQIQRFGEPLPVAA